LGMAIFISREKRRANYHIPFLAVNQMLPFFARLLRA